MLERARRKKPMIHEGTAVLLGYDDHVTGCVLLSFYLFPVTKRLSVSKSQGIASHTICFPYISTEVCEVYIIHV